jgi:MerR family transcriptional regulator, heat shock protein HspR
MTGGGRRLHDGDEGVYGISVAAELSGMAPSSLRAYETRGLLEPERTAGGTRRYSVNDIARLRTIGDLLEDGLNLAGVDRVLALQAENRRLRDHCAERHVDRADGRT